MTDSSLLLAQREVLHGVWLATPAGKVFSTLHAETAAVPKVKVASARRARRNARSYLPTDTRIPLGTPRPERMREVKKRPIGNPLAWAEHAPASGCREMRRSYGSVDTHAGSSSWGGKPRPYFAMTTDDRLDAMEWVALWRAVHTTLPSD